MIMNAILQKPDPVTELLDQNVVIPGANRVVNFNLPAVSVPATMANLHSIFDETLK